MEDRLLMSVNAYASNRTIVIETSGDSNVDVYREDNDVVFVVDADTDQNVAAFAGAAFDRILFKGGSGQDDFRNNTAIPAEIYGGIGHDYIIGGRGNDTIYGGTGNDYLIGWDGDDNIYGGLGRDRLEGQGGMDGLFGGIGLDSEYGSSYSDVDTLIGGLAADRFLSGAGDIVQDSRAEDAIITISNATAGSINLGSGNFSYTAGTWNDSEVQTIDLALANLHMLAGNTKLLKNRNGTAISFQRAGVPSQSQWLAWNSGTLIGFFNGNSDAQLVDTTYHEIAHNWDDTSENPFITEFRKLSDWRQGSTAPTSNHLASTRQGDDWWYSNSAQFARNYGFFSPFEDFGTTWETYFNRNGGNAVVQSKLDIVDKLFAALRPTEAQLQQQLGFRTLGNWYQNIWGNDEKWFQDNNNSWHFITPDGNVYRMDGSSIDASTVVAMLDASAYDNPLAQLVKDVSVGTPTLTGPAGSTADTTPTLRWNAAQNASWYYVYVKNNDTGDITYNWVNNATEFTHATLAEAGYTFKVRAWGNGYYGDWSAEMQFTIEVPKPATATLNGPGGNTTDTTPTLRWNSAENASWYQVFIRNNNSGEVITQWVSSSTEYTHGTALAAGSYTFWVRTWGSGKYGDWSQSMNFGIVETASQLRDAHNFRSTGELHFNYRGENEKWFIDGNSVWHFIKEDGSIYRRSETDQSEYEFFTKTDSYVYTYMEYLFLSDAELSRMWNLKYSSGFKSAGNYYLNYIGENEKWFLDRDNTWHYIKEDGRIFRHNGSGFDLVTQVDRYYYASPDRLFYENVLTA